MSSIKNLLIGFILSVGLLSVNAYSETLSGWRFESLLEELSTATVKGQGKYVKVGCINYPKVNSLSLLITKSLPIKNYGNHYKKLKNLKIKIDDNKTQKFKISINAEAAYVIDLTGTMDFTIYGKTSKRYTNDSEINIFIEDKKLEQLIKQMVYGNKMLIQIENYPIEVSLKGSAQPIKKVLNKCGIK